MWMTHPKPIYNIYKNKSIKYVYFTNKLDYIICVCLYFHRHFILKHHFLQLQFVHSYLWQFLYVLGDSFCFWFGALTRFPSTKHGICASPKWRWYLENPLWYPNLNRCGAHFGLWYWDTSISPHFDWKLGLVGIKLGDDNTFTNQTNGLGCSSSHAHTKTISPL
jgi:hypothetical protein